MAKKWINSKTGKRVSVAGEEQDEGLLGLPPPAGPLPWRLDAKSIRKVVVWRDGQGQRVCMGPRDC